MSVMFDQPDSGVGVDPAAVDQETLGRHERQILERLGHIPGAINVPVGATSRVHQLPKPSR